ncbi:Uma2 family endonuclease [Actinacidiphila yeochonensis]|uniref:Uma2 family endonuclease n=1 Tax=Actinacidiphila yeochonensis TaxID=89050 RepID=UPI00068B8904|nr:Uma2 family endonuclease [Actinacidiphila yeochonensis]
MEAPRISTAGSGHPAGHTWPKPPPGGWTAPDLDHLPGLPAHTEMLDGGLFFSGPQTYAHMAVLRLLEHALVGHAPSELRVVRERAVTLGPRDRPEPDLMVVSPDARTGTRQTTYAPGDVLLAVEVVSAESEHRDRAIKPRKYARAGIRHFWRVEDDAGSPVVYVHELDPGTGSYAVAGVHHGELRVSVPFPVAVDLAEAGRRAPGAQRGAVEGRAEGRAGA